MKKLLILGGSGFIGRNMKEFFLSQYEIVTPSHLELDVLNENLVKEYLEKGQFNVILNCLDQHEMNGMYFENKLRMFSNLAKYNHLYGKMIYFGTGAEYARDLPIKEIREEEFGRRIPTDTYGCCMYHISQLAMQSNNIYNLRLFGIFGKYELWQHRFISNAICKSIYGYPITIRQNLYFDYLYIDDLCRIVEWFIENNPEYNDYNAVSGRRYSLKEIADIVVKESDRDLSVFIAKEGMGKEYSASNQRLCREFPEFQAEDIHLSISKLMDWYRTNITDIDNYKLLYQ